MSREPNEGETVNLGGIDFIIVSTYGLDQAIADGVLWAFDPESWPVITGGKALVVTAAIRETFTDDQIKAIWDRYVHWRHHVKDTLPVEDQMFQVQEKGQKVWIIEDGASFCVMRPEDY